MLIVFVHYWLMGSSARVWWWECHGVCGDRLLSWVDYYSCIDPRGWFSWSVRRQNHSETQINAPECVRRDPGQSCRLNVLLLMSFKQWRVQILRRHYCFSTHSCFRWLYSLQTLDFSHGRWERSEPGLCSSQTYEDKMSGDGFSFSYVLFFIMFCFSFLDSIVMSLINWSNKKLTIYYII